MVSDLGWLYYPELRTPIGKKNQNRWTNIEFIFKQILFYRRIRLKTSTSTVNQKMTAHKQEQTTKTPYHTPRGPNSKIASKCTAKTKKNPRSGGGRPPPPSPDFVQPQYYVQIELIICSQTHTSIGPPLFSL